jgi:hypothetical protein
MESSSSWSSSLLDDLDLDLVFEPDLDLVFDADLEDLDLVSDFLDRDERLDLIDAPLPLSSDSCDDPETLELSEVLGLGLLLGGFL